MKLLNLAKNLNELQLNSYIKILFSYETPVAYINYKEAKGYQVKIKYSKTTIKHIDKWKPGHSSNFLEIDQSILDDMVENI